MRRPKDRFEPPCWLRGDGPPALEILACQNGLLHLPSRQLQDPTPDFFTRNALAFAFNPAAPEPKEWLAFLDSIWKSDPEVIGLLQEFMGYLLLPDTSQQKILLMIGPPRSGKGTIAETMRELVGRVNTCSPSAGSLAGDFGREPLLNKTLAIMSDVRVGTRTNKASLIETLLAVSGEDAVTVGRKYKRAWEGHLRTRFVIMTNDLPDLPDPSGALASRMLPLVMTKSFLGSEDHGLKGRIRAELPGILLWAVEGWRRLQERGHFELPASARDTIQDLAEVGTPVARFLRDVCVREDEARTPKDALYERWERWRLDEGVLDGPAGKNALTRDLRSLGISAARVSVEGVRQQVYVGVKIA